MAYLSNLVYCFAGYYWRFLFLFLNSFLGGAATVKVYFKSLVNNFGCWNYFFGYYLDDVRRETPTKLAKYFAWVTSVLVLIVIVGAFFVVGSPSTARLIQFDQQKVTDLQGIQSQIVNIGRRKPFCLIPYLI